MNVLIIGSGGREHALAYKAAQSPRVETVFVAPGNAGTATEAGLQNVAIDPLDFDALAQFASQNDVGLTIVGPEAPLVAGIVDDFTARGLPCFGPSALAAQLEGSKAFTKEFLARHKIPTAAYQTFTEIEPAVAYIKEQGAPIVVKADGLAAGKGVIVAQSEQEAIDAVTDMLSGNAFGDAGCRVVIEECLVGEEASFIVVCDGQFASPMASSQDHKRIGEGDTGPNTGGMGAYSPAPVVTPEIHERIMNEVIYPTLRGMASEGAEYTGFLYAGLMIDTDGTPKVIEFNCRFGDPETQGVLALFKGDLFDAMMAAVDGKVDTLNLENSPQAALCLVLASGGYPGSYEKGKAIRGLDEAAKLQDVKVFHAGTAKKNGQVVTTGGRVLGVTAMGDSIAEAKRQAYAAVKCIRWDGAWCRKDISDKALG